MTSTLLRSLLVCGGLLCAMPAFAQSTGLGLRFAEAELSYSTTTATRVPSGRITGDFRISYALGVQMDVSAISYPGGWLGQIDAHLYLMPRETLKYGVFLSLADIDGREATIGSAGVEAIADLSDRLQIDAKAEIGIATHSNAGTRRNMDFIAASFGTSYALNDTTTGYISASVTEFEEVYLRAVAYGLRVGLHYDIPKHPIRISAALGYDKLSGRNGGRGEALAQIGVTWRFGAGGKSVANRSFARSKPLDQLLRRGLF
jgi:hypothetical protein